MGMVKTEKILYWTRQYITSALSMSQLRQAQDPELMIEEEAERVVVKMSQMVLTDRVLDSHPTVACEVEVPWSCAVYVTAPQGWLGRLLGLHQRGVWREVSGTVKGYGQVQVHLEHHVQFPNPNRAYPAEFGRPVRFSQYEIEGQPVIDTYSATADAAYAAEHRR